MSKNDLDVKRCLGLRCPMQADKVDPRTCRAVEYCEYAMPYTEFDVLYAQTMISSIMKKSANEISARREPDIVVVNGNPVVRCKNYQAGACILHSTTCVCPDYSPIKNREP